MWVDSGGTQNPNPTYSNPTYVIASSPTIGREYFTHEYDQPQFAAQPNYTPFSDEQFIAEQLFADPKHVRIPEHRLQLATVAQTWRDLFTKRHHAEAKRWFLSKAADHPFTFAAICDYLDVSPKRLRQRARRVHLRPRQPLTSTFTAPTESSIVAA